MKSYKQQVSVYEQERENYRYNVANARQSAVVAHTTEIENLRAALQQKSEEVTRFQKAYNEVLSEASFFSARVLRLTLIWLVIHFTELRSERPD